MNSPTVKYSFRGNKKTTLTSPLNLRTLIYLFALTLFIFIPVQIDYNNLMFYDMNLDDLPDDMEIDSSQEISFEQPKTIPNIYKIE